MRFRLPLPHPGHGRPPGALKPRRPPYRHLIKKPHNVSVYNINNVNEIIQQTQNKDRTNADAPPRGGGERPASRTGAGAANSRQRCSCPFPQGRPAAWPPYRAKRTETRCSCPSLPGRRAAGPPYRVRRTKRLERWRRRASKSPWGVGVRGVEGVRTYTLGVIWRN